MKNTKWSESQLRDIVEWDIATWRKAVEFWETYVDTHVFSPSTMQLLEIGARGGGITLLFAQKGFSCTCSDKGETFDKARALHASYGVEERVTYLDADALALPFPDASFDAVVFKSVLGAIGRSGHDERIEAAIAEMLRVLKPGGLLFFAENLQGMLLHSALRRLFKRWGSSWNYASPDRMRKLLAGFDKVELHTYGCFGAFLKDHPLTRKADELFCRRDPSPHHYMCYGVAQKAFSIQTKD